MIYYTKVYGNTKEEAEKKAEDEIKNIDFMRQPTLYSVSQVNPADECAKGIWCAVIKYWGLD